MTIPFETREKSTVLFPVTRKGLRWARRQAETLLANLGLMVQYTLDVIGFIRAGQLKKEQFFQQASFIGLDTLGISLVMTTVSGMVIALQVATEMVKQGAGSYVGALVSLAMLRELAPIMTGFAVIAMAGSAFAAELATMQISSQIDALRVLHIHPIRYLVVPRVVAGTLALPIITIITGFTGIVGGLLISTLLTELSAEDYLHSVWTQTSPRDIFICLFKSMVFGYLLTIISTSVGINTKGGAKEVGTATTRAVVWSFVMMAIFDYLITYLFYGTK